MIYKCYIILACVRDGFARIMIPSGERVIIHFGGDMTVGDFTDMLKADYSVDSSISDQGNSLSRDILTFALFDCSGNNINFSLILLNVF